MRIRLVPPTLKVLALLILHRKDLQYPVAWVYERMEHCPDVSFDTNATSLGNGLTLTLTESSRGILAWIHETSCHSFCCVLGRECGAEIEPHEWLKKIEEKHNEWLAKIPSV